MAPMKGETVLFNPSNNKFCVLNATAASIWNALQHAQSVPEIAAALAKQYAKLDPRRAEDDVRKTLRELQDIDCVVAVD
jgi:hypothetical protein